MSCDLKFFQHNISRMQDFGQIWHKQTIGMEGWLVKFSQKSLHSGIPGQYEKGRQQRGHCPKHALAL